MLRSCLARNMMSRRRSLLLVLLLSVLLDSFSSGWKLAPKPRRSHLRSTPEDIHTHAHAPAPAPAPANTHAHKERFAELKETLRREYASFFSPMDTRFYDNQVQFIDPLNDLAGVAAYQSNVDMLGGKTVLGRILFQGAGIQLHSIEDLEEFKIQTRWTLQIGFKILPWQPTAKFSGISIYTLDPQGKVLKQEDFWDSINLKDGRYVEVPKLFGARDFIKQILPKPVARIAEALPFELMRRASRYEVRKYPSLLSIEAPSNEQIEDYLSGKNGQGRPVTSLPLSLRTISKTAGLQRFRRIIGMNENSASGNVKTLPEPVQSGVSLVEIPKQLVAAFAVLPTQPVDEMLFKQQLTRDGLVCGETASVVQVTAEVFSPTPQEVWIPLVSHPWQAE